MASTGSLIPLNCPNCQAPMQPLGNNPDMAICTFCGTQARIPSPARPSPGVQDVSGNTILTTDIPQGWSVSSAGVDWNGGSGVWPWRVYATFSGPSGEMASYLSPTEYVWRSAKMQQLMATYGNSATSAAEPQSRPFPLPAEFYLDAARSFLSPQAQPTLSYLGQIPSPLPQALLSQKEMELGQAMRAESEQLARTSGVAATVDAIYSRGLTRFFSFALNGAEWRMAVYALIVAQKVSMPSMPMMMGGFGGLGGMLSGLFGNTQPTPQFQPQYTPAQQQVMAQVPGMSDDAEAAAFRSCNASQDLGWRIEEMFALAAPKDGFSEVYDNAFSQIVRTTKLSSPMQENQREYARMLKNGLDSSVADFKAQSQRMLAQSMEYSRQMNAASDARMASWQAQSDAHHKAVMERGHEMFGSSGGTSSISDKWSEAILGQNTYVDQYGDEHTVSNRWDTAYRDDAGNIIGTESGVEPGFGWTEMKRK